VKPIQRTKQDVPSGFRWHRDPAVHAAAEATLDAERARLNRMLDEHIARRDGRGRCG
jgi:hypothetical protein